MFRRGEDRAASAPAESSGRISAIPRSRTDRRFVNRRKKKKNVYEVCVRASRVGALNAAVGETKKIVNKSNNSERGRTAALFIAVLRPRRPYMIITSYERNGSFYEIHLKTFHLSADQSHDRFVAQTNGET